VVLRGSRFRSATRLLLIIGHPSRGWVMCDFRDFVNNSAGDWGELDGRRGAAGARRPNRIATPLWDLLCEKTILFVNWGT
jgi:hypothetical protein